MTFSRYLILPLLSLLTALPDGDGLAQTEVIFDDSELAVIEVTMHPDSLNWLLEEENLENNRYLPASLHYTTSEIDTNFDNIGIRLRGNTSRESAKKSFKLSFNAFDDEGEFFGLKKFNLNGEHNDPSVIRSKLCWDLFQTVRVPASRAAHARFYINGEYRGLYIHVEEYDGSFLERQFGSNDGNFFKCLWPADLAYIGDDPNLYKFTSGDRRAYDLRTNEEEDDYSDLAHFINVLNNLTGDAFIDSLEASFDVWDYLKVQAVEVLAGHWDNYWYNKNNFFLYHNPVDDRFVYIPYDVDNTFGIWWDFIEPGQDWGTKNIYAWGNIWNEPRPLTDRILDVDQYRNLYTYFIGQLLAQAFNDGPLFVRIGEIGSRIRTAAEEDPYRPLDYGWSYEDFLNSYNLPLGGHVTYGLRPFVTTRHNSAQQQTQARNISPVFLKEPAVEFAADPMRIRVSADLFDETVPASVLVYRRIDSQYTTTPMELVVTYNEGLADIYRYACDLPVSPGEIVSFYIDVSDAESAFTTYPRHAPVELIDYEVFGITINEFLAANNETNADEYGEYDDWIELYNAGDEPINLSGWFLTDDPAERNRWSFPDTSISAGEFLIVWTDGDEEQGLLHTNFRLERNGEFAGLYYDDGSHLTVIDSITFGYQETDISYGRYPDGGAAWGSMEPTPGMLNGIHTTASDQPRIPSGFKLITNYPNPFNASTTIRLEIPRSEFVRLEIFNLLGRRISVLIEERLNAGIYEVRFPCAGYASGLYLARVQTGNTSYTHKMLLLR